MSFDDAVTGYCEGDEARTEHGRMKQFLRHLYRDTDVGSRLLAPAATIYDFLRYRLLPTNTFLKRIFWKSQGYELNLEDPTTLNEKIQWLKLHDRDPLLKLCADKLAVREYIERKFGAKYLAPLEFHTDDPEDIRPEKLPDYPFIIKTTHSSGDSIIVMDKSKVNWKRARRELSRSLRTNHYYRTREWQYREIEPRMMVEKLLTDQYGVIPLDYKFHCLNGKLVFLQVDIGRHADHRRNLYTPDWVLLDCRLAHENGGEIRKPEKLDEMTSLAETIAQEFTYVRVDFFYLGSEIIVGELTFHPGSGFEVFSPQCWDRKLGEKLILS
ncbi:MAG: ATP-grasp fold amidoligase family protein [Woeseiaceae bacterium]